MRLVIKTAVISAIFFSATCIAQPIASNKQAFIDQMVTQWSFKRSYLEKLLAHRPADNRILKAMSTPYEAKPWTSYRKHFLTPDRITHGVEYWNQNKSTLLQAEKKYGVDPKIIVAIIGVESHYGRHRGTYSVLNTLNTLAFHYPRRSKFFTKELAAYLRLTRKDNVDPTTIKGSYAGAIGMTQFMPSSILHYGVHVGAPPINLQTDNADAIMSVANYLAKNGWRRGQAIANPIKSDAMIISTDKKITKIKEGILLVPTTKSSKLWKVTRNFKSIMSYNPRYSYALAVTQLGDAIKHQRGKSKQHG
jgi:membrane-bound lytic murein transglycosylase B